MANWRYDFGSEGIGDQSIDMLNDDIRIVCVDADDYTPSKSLHKFLSSIPAGARVATSGSLTGKKFTAGVFDSDPTTISSVTGDTFEMLVMYQHTGTDSTARLIAKIDEGVPNLPHTPDGGPVKISPSTGANKWFKL